MEIIMQALADAPIRRATAFGPEPVRSYYDRRHAEAIAAYADQMNQLDTFWRAVPEQPFPWEK